ncbi:MAG: hypothetical protein ACR2OX_03690 [Methyloligellaceae bacterium]
MRHLIGGVISVALSVAPAWAEEWSCRNKSAEIRCDAKACKVILPDGFTPMDLTVKTTGAVSLCAYSGCWAGQASGTLRAGRYFTVIGLKLPWSGTGGSTGHVAATIDTEARVAIILTGGFAHPMTCTKR